MTTYVWKSWGGGPRRVEADTVTFEPAHVVFWATSGPSSPRLLLAVANANINDLSTVDAIVDRREFAGRRDGD